MRPPETYVRELPPWRSVDGSALSVLVVALVLSIVLHPAGAQEASGCGTATDIDATDVGTTEIDTTEIDTDAINELLSARSAAVRSGDLTALALTRAADAPASLAATDERTLDGFTRVGLSVYEEALAEPVVDLAPPGAVGPVLAVRRTHRISGIDSTDHVSHLYLTFAERDGRWLVACDDDLTRIGVFGERELWELTDVRVVRTERSIVVGSVGEARLQQVSDLLGQALDLFVDNWPSRVDPDPWDGTVAMIVPRNRTEAEMLLRPTIDISKFVAFTTLDIDLAPVSEVPDGPDAGWSVVAPRIVAQEGNFGRRSPERQIEVLVHELAHIASVQVSGPNTPLWMHEGLAEWVTAGRPASGEGRLEFPDLHLFRTGTSTQIAAVYDQAFDTMVQLADEFGPEAPVDLFSAVGGRRLVAGTSDRVFADSVLAEFGVDLGSLGS